MDLMPSPASLARRATEGLVVGGTVDARLDLAGLLSRYRCRATIQRSPGTGLAMLTRFPFDVVVIDTRGVPQGWKWSDRFALVLRERGLVLGLVSDRPRSVTGMVNLDVGDLGSAVAELVDMATNRHGTSQQKL